MTIECDPQFAYAARDDSPAAAPLRIEWCDPSPPSRTRSPGSSHVRRRLPPAARRIADAIIAAPERRAGHVGRRPRRPGIRQRRQRRPALPVDRRARLPGAEDRVRQGSRGRARIAARGHRQDRRRRERDREDHRQQRHGARGDRKVLDAAAGRRGGRRAASAPSGSKSTASATAAPIAQDAAYRFIRLGLPVSCVVDLHAQAVSASFAGRGSDDAHHLAFRPDRSTPWPPRATPRPAARPRS